MISVYIEGDKSNFATKGAVDRFKRDLRNDDQDKLKVNDYFKDEWTYKLLLKSESEIKVEIVKKNIKILTDTEIEAKEKRLVLKDKLKAMRNSRTTACNIKLKMKNSSVPDDLLEAYMTLKKITAKLPVPILDPAEVLAHPLEYKEQIFTLIQSFGLFQGKTNPIINYYRLLAEHMGLSTAPVNPVNPTNPANLVNPTTNFINELRNQRDSLHTEVDDEMKKIYEKLGIDINNKDTDTEITELLEKIPGLI